jgi:hypothetical protein
MSQRFVVAADALADISESRLAVVVRPVGVLRLAGQCG